MAADPNQKPVDEFEEVDDALEDVLYARHAEIKTFEDLQKERGTTIPALFNILYKFVQNPSSVSVETYKRMLDTCDTLGSGVDFLITALAARMGRYIHPDEEITKYVNDTLDQIDGGWTNAVKTVLSAVWAGMSVGEIVWANTERGFVPRKIIGLPPTTLLFETERTGELTPDGILQYQRNYNPFIGSSGFNVGFGVGFTGGAPGRPDPFAKFGDFPFPLRAPNSFNYLSIRIPCQKCIHYAFNAQGQSGNPYGHSLLRRAYKYYVMEDAIHQMMMIALDRKGTPLNIVFADPNAMIEDPEADKGNGAADYRNKPKTSLTAAKAAHDAFKNVHNDSTIVLPGKNKDVYEIEQITQNSNAADFLAAIKMCKESKLRSLMIPALIFGAGDGSGSFALGETHSKTFDTICDSVLSGVEHVLLQQLVKQIIAYNFPRSQWGKAGLGAFSKRTLSKEEIQKEMEVYEKGINTGIIDANDMNDLNKMRDTIGFEPRATPIDRASVLIDKFGNRVEGVDPSQGLQTDQSGKIQSVTDGGQQEGEPGKQAPPGAPDKDTKEQAAKKRSIMTRLMAVIQDFFKRSET